MVRFVISVVVGLSISSPVAGVLYFDTDSSTHNTTAPTDGYADSGWQYQGYFGSKLGTMISPNHFITASHIGISSTFVHDALFSGDSTVTYAVNSTVNGGTGYWDIPNSDLRVFQISGQFPTFAPLYVNNDEVGKEMVFFGRGGPRGTEVTLGLELKGWRTTAEDGVARWGRNIVTDALTDSDLGSLLAAEFNASAGIDEAHLSGGDSGGGAFILDTDGVWKLAGINAAVDGRWDTNDTTGDGTDFDAALFDAGGFYLGTDADGWMSIMDENDDIPSSLYVSRISAYGTDILAVIPEPSGASLLGATSLMFAAAWLTRRRR